MTERKKRHTWMYLLAAMILLAALVIALVLLVVYCSSDAEFSETAWRTDTLLSVISFGLLLANLIFCWCALRWRRRPGN